MIHGVGVDIIEIKRIENAIQRYGDRFLNRIYTPAEQEYCLKHREPARHFAGRFAAKEAVVKALGTGFGEGVSWLDIEIINNVEGKPEATLAPTLQKRFSENNDSFSLNISVSHCREYATAFAVCEINFVPVPVPEVQ